MVIRLGADLDRDQLMARRALRRLAPRQQIGPWPPDRVLHDIGQEGGEDEADEEAEERDVHLVPAGARQPGPQDDEAEGDAAGVEEQPADGDALGVGVRVLLRRVREQEHAVEGLDQELHEEVGEEEEGEAEVVGRVGSLWMRRVSFFQGLEAGGWCWRTCRNPRTPPKDSGCIVGEVRTILRRIVVGEGTTCERISSHRHCVVRAADCKSRALPSHVALKMIHERCGQP